MSCMLWTFTVADPGGQGAPLPDQDQGPWVLHGQFLLQTIPFGTPAGHWKRKRLGSVDSGYPDIDFQFPLFEFSATILNSHLSKRWMHTSYECMTAHRFCIQLQKRGNFVDVKQENLVICLGRGSKSFSCLWISICKSQAPGVYTAERGGRCRVPGMKRWTWAQTLNIEVWLQF